MEKIKEFAAETIFLVTDAAGSAIKKTAKKFINPKDSGFLDVESMTKNYGKEFKKKMREGILSFVSEIFPEDEEEKEKQQEVTSEQSQNSVAAKPLN